MFAVIRTGGKQYCIKPGDVLKVEKLNSEPSSTVSLTDVVLMSSNDGNVIVGSPFVKGAIVKAEVIKQMKDPKIIVFKKKRRHNYRRKNGHRQPMTVLKITDVELSE